MSSIRHMRFAFLRPACRVAAALLLALITAPTPAASQAPPDTILRISLGSGRSLPIHTDAPISRVSVANPDIADAVVVSERDVVFNGKAHGETDIVLWIADQPLRHYRVDVRPVGDGRMILLSVKLAEVRRDVLRQLNVSGLYKDKDGKTRIGWGALRSDQQIDATGKVILPFDTKFLTVLSDLGTKDFLGLLDVEEQRGNARLLAEPNLLTANRDSASFLAGGELPIPVLQTGLSNSQYVTIQYREFGVRLSFVPEIVSDSTMKLWVRPEVSSIDYANALTIAGFKIPALRTRRVSSTVDVKNDQSLVISGLFNDERERVRTGIPLLMNLPVLGALFSSSRWQSAASELIVIVTPTLIDPSRVPERLLRPTEPETRRPAEAAFEKPQPKKP